MKRIKPSLVLAAAAVVGMALWASAYVEQTGSRMAVAADRFLESLPQGPGREGRLRLRFARADLNWHFIPRDRQGHPDQGADARAARPGLRPDLHRARGRRLPQGHDDHEPGTGPPGHRAGQGPGARPRAVFPDDLRHALRPRASGAGASRGTTSRSTSCSRTARSSRPRPASSAPIPAEVRQGPRQGLRTPGRPRGHGPPAGPGARRQPEEDRRSSRPRPPRRSAPRARPSRPPTPRRGSATPT